MSKIYLLSFFLGFILSSPLGPIGLICLRRTFTGGRKSGLISALGISVAYGFWSFGALHGVKSIAYWIEQEKFILGLIIGIFYLFYGLHGIFNDPLTSYTPIKKNDRATEFFSTFLVVFLNPGTFVMFVIYFALFGVSNIRYTLLETIAVALFIFIGSIVFWLILTQLLHHVKKKIP